MGRHLLRPRRPHLPPRGVQRVQGPPPEDGGRPRGAAPVRAAGLRGLRPAHPRRAGLRGRRRHRHPGRAGGGVRAQGGGGLRRQGPAAARDRRRPGPEPRPRGRGVGDVRPQDGRGEVRRAARSAWWTCWPWWGTRSTTSPACPASARRARATWSASSARVEEVIANADKVKRTAYREGLQAHADSAILSKRLVTLRTDVPVTLDLEAVRRRPPDRAAAHALFTELEFIALAKEFAPEAGPSRTTHRVLSSRDEIAAAVAEARAAGQVALCFVRDAREPMRASPLGVGLAWRAGEAVYVPIAHSPLENPGAPPARGDPRAAEAAAGGHRGAEALRARQARSHPALPARASAARRWPSTRWWRRTC